MPCCAIQYNRFASPYPRGINCSIVSFLQVADLIEYLTRQETEAMLVRLDKFSTSYAVPQLFRAATDHSRSEQRTI